MAFWKPSVGELLKSNLHHVNTRFNGLRGAVKKQLGWLAPPRIMPYRGFGNAQRFHLLGRVLEDRQLGSPMHDDPWWENAAAMYRRYAVYSYSEVRIGAEYAGQTLVATTDAEGRFAFHWKPRGPLIRDQLWHPIRLTLLDDDSEDGPLRAVGKIFTPPAECQFGVISDIDDTILYSNVADFWQMVRIASMHNARTRTPLPGVAALYRALEQGNQDGPCNPFFYVSSSSWNLYDLLVDFLALHDLPTGPVFLRNLGADPRHPVKSGHKHKLDRIREIMGTYASLPFLLIGDAGQDDPEIYRQAVHDFPGRIHAIYIRTVADRNHDAKVHRIAKEIQQLGSEILLVEDTHTAIEHALARGWTAREALPQQWEQVDLTVQP